MQSHLYDLIKEYGEDILTSQNFRKTGEHMQHGTMPVRSHSISVAKHSLAISRKLRIKCNQRELVRGALLHDYFLYDWHLRDDKNPHRLHGFFHPGRALKNASAEYHLTDLEKDIIKKHMWPMTVIPPLYKEAWIVSLADKYCSLFETMRIHGRKRTKKQRISA